MTVIIFLAVLAVLIFVHELGHFLFARMSGIRVDAFKIGFGPRILSWTRGETEYGLNLIPFGGFVKIHGENPDDESMYGPDAKRSFANKNRFAQVAVLAAGVLFNFIFAWLIYVIVFASGVTATIDGFDKYADYFKNERIMVTYVNPESPAAKAGLIMGDIVKSIDGVGKEKIADIQDSINASKGHSIQFEYMRGKESAVASVTPVVGLVEDKYAIGIAMSDVADLKLPFFTSIYEGAHYTLVTTKDTAVGLYTFFKNVFSGTANFSDVSGPIGIAGIVGNAADLGFKYLLMVTAIISINLGVINLIPFPALDGGRILFVLVEGIVRKRIPVKFTNTVNAVGFVLLMALMVVVTYKDILKLLR